MLNSIIIWEPISGQLNCWTFHPVWKEYYSPIRTWIRRFQRVDLSNLLFDPISQSVVVKYYSMFTSVRRTVACQTWFQGSFFRKKLSYGQPGSDEQSMVSILAGKQPVPIKFNVWVNIILAYGHCYRDWRRPWKLARNSQIFLEVWYKFDSYRVETIAKVIMWHSENEHEHH